MKNIRLLAAFCLPLLITLSASLSYAQINGGGSTGEVPFFTGTGAVGGSPNLYWDASRNYMGIGTASPRQRLELNGNLYLSAPGSGIIFPDGSVQTTSAQGRYFR